MVRIPLFPYGGYPMSAESERIVNQLHELANPANVAGMARYGINSTGTLGISIYTLRNIAKEIGVNHSLALELWETGIHEARLLAAFIEEPALVSPGQMDKWANDFDSWDVCDQVCTSLFDLTIFAYPKAYEWSEQSQEFVKRAAFSLMAGLAVHDKKADDEKIASFLPIIVREAGDDRNYVKKAINWALRNIGKRNFSLNMLAIETARDLKNSNMRAARWIGSDALRELASAKIQAMLVKKSNG
jgi:3-methyladenine DNA glycosylase AlkD